MIEDQKPRAILGTNSTHYFQTDHLKVDLKERSVRGGIVTIAAQACKFILSIGSTMVLARLLTPKDFGLIAMVTAVTNFMLTFKNMGLSMATVQREEIDHSQISTLFWINVVISIAIMLLTAAFAPAIAWFYGKPQLIWVTLALAGTFIFGGLTIQHQALLRRQMRFVVLSAIEVTSVSLGITAAIISAWYGVGYWALVVMQIVTTITTTIGVWSMCGWRPGLPVRHSGVRSMLAFGGNLTGFNLLNYFARNLDNVLIGRYWGSQQLGLYAKAYQLLLLPLQQINAPITSVAIPTLSRLQDDPERYRRYYCNAISLIAFVTTPLIAVMAALSDEIILILLGNQWLGASAIFKVLAFAALMQPFGSATGWVYISLGQTRRMMQWALISVPLYILSFVIGIRWGTIGVATSYTICVYLLLFPMFYFAFKYSPIKVVDIIKSTWRPVTISGAIYIVMVQTRLYLTTLHPLLILLVSCIIGLTTMVLFILIWPKARVEALNIMVEITKILKSKRGYNEDCNT